MPTPQVFSSPGVAAPDDHAGGEVAWDILYAAVDKTAARTQVIDGLTRCHVARAVSELAVSWSACICSTSDMLPPARY